MLKFLTDLKTSGESNRSHFLIKSMKTSRSFTRPNRILSVLRFGSGLILSSAALAMAFVAVNPSGPLLVGKSDGKNQAIGTAEEDYANRAFPAAYVPFKLTLNAHGAFNKVKTRSNANSSSSIGSWTLIG